MAYFPKHGKVHRLFEDDGELWTGAMQIAPPPPGRHHLVVGSTDSAQLSLALAELRGLRIRGARLASMPEQTPQERAAWLFAEDEPRAALAALADAGEHDAALLRLLAFAELGDLGGAAAAAAAVLAESGEARRGELALALRRYPLAAAALRAAGGAALLPTLRATWAFAYAHRNDADLRAEILAGLREIELLTPTNTQEQAALAALLEARAELWARSGEASRASRDRAAAARMTAP